MKHFLFKALCGLIIGVGSVLPGVSGGVMAVSMGLYEDMIEAISHFFKSVKKNFLFLLPIAIGAVIGLFLTSFVLKAVIDRFETELLCLFIGLVLGGIPDLFKEAKGSSPIRIKHIISAIVGIGVILLFGFLEGGAVSTGPDGKLNILTALICGGVLALGVVIPGISSSFILIYMGLYSPIMGAITELDIVPLLFAVIGFAAVALLIIKGVNLALKKFHSISYFAIMGFSIGSVALIVPMIISGINLIAVGLLLLGLIISTLQSVYKRKTSVSTS